eukprot:UN23451
MLKAKIICFSSRRCFRNSCNRCTYVWRYIGYGFWWGKGFLLTRLSKRFTCHCVVIT